MPSRTSKEKALKRNVEVSTERAYRSALKNRGEGENRTLRDKIRKEFEESARRVDRTKLHEVWND